MLHAVIRGQFTFFWYKDCFPHGYYFFGWKVAETALAASAIGTVISEANHIIFLPLVRPDKWRDKFGGRPLIIIIMLVGGDVFTPFIYAAMTGSPHLYTVILILEVWQNAWHTVGTSALDSLEWDCLPSDAGGRPLSPSRDLALFSYAGHIPSTGWPLLMAGAFHWFRDSFTAFRTFFVVGGVINAFALAVLVFLVHPRDEPLNKLFQWGRGRYHAEYDAERVQGLAGPEMVARRDEEARVAARRRAQETTTRRPPNYPPYGAQCCDAILFGKGGATRART